MILMFNFRSFANWNAPPVLAQWLAGAPPTALRNSDDGVRPIAMGKTFRRLICSFLLARIAYKARRILTPLQIGMTVKGGCEASIHAAHELQGVQKIIADFQTQVTTALFE